VRSGYNMCQISVYVEKNGVEELRFEDVTSLVVDGKDIKVSTLFAGATEVNDAFISSIDFMGGKVLVQQSG
jgi:predicted RNA-binding protein